MCVVFCQPLLLVFYATYDGYTSRLTSSAVRALRTSKLPSMHEIHTACPASAIVIGGEVVIMVPSRTITYEATCK